MKSISIVVFAVFVVCTLDSVCSFGVFDDIALTVTNAFNNLKALIESPARRRKLKELKCDEKIPSYSYNPVKSSSKIFVQMTPYVTTEAQNTATAISISISRINTSEIVKLKDNQLKMKPINKLLSHLIPFKKYNRLLNQTKNLTRPAQLSRQITWPEPSILTKLLPIFTTLDLIPPKRIRSPPNVTKTSSKWSRVMSKRVKTESKRVKAPHNRNNTRSKWSNKPAIGKLTTSYPIRPILTPHRQWISFREWLKRLHSEK